MARPANFAALLAVISRENVDLAGHGEGGGTGKAFRMVSTRFRGGHAHALPEFMFLGANADRVARVLDWYGTSHGGQSDVRTPPDS